MIQIDKETKEKRNAEYNMKARKYPAYLSLAIPIMLGVAMGVKDMEGAGIWIKVLTYLISISAISTALFFLLRFSLRSIAKFYPERILFCDRLKPTARILYSNDNTYTEEQKANIREKILAKKKIDLRKYKPKTFKNKKYVKRIDEAVRWLLDVTRFDEILLGEYLVGIGILILLLVMLVTWVAYCNGKTFAKRMYDVFLNMNDNDNDIYYF